MPLEEIYLCRHGATEWSKAGRHTGHTDLPLVEEGKKQARLLNPILSKVTFSAVYSSPLLRATQTAKLAGFEHFQLTDALREWNYGEFEGKKTAEIREHIPNWNIFDFGAKGGESVQQIQKRVTTFLEELKQHEGRVLLFSSAHLSRALAATWLGAPVAFGKHLQLSTASLSILGYEREWPTLIKWNNTFE